MSHKETWKANEQLILDADKTLEDIEREYFKQLNTSKQNRPDYLLLDAECEVSLFRYDQNRQHLITAAALIMRLLIKEPK